MDLSFDLLIALLQVLFDSFVLHQGSFIHSFIDFSLNYFSAVSHLQILFTRLHWDISETQIEIPVVTGWQGNTKLP